MGGYFILVALDVVPSPGAAKAPMWIVSSFAAGLRSLAGIGVMTPALVTGEVRNDGELPAGAPQWLRLMQYLLGLTLFATFALIGTWVAIGGGARSFSFSGFFVTSGGGETVGRIVFASAPSSPGSARSASRSRAGASSSARPDAAKSPCGHALLGLHHAWTMVIKSERVAADASGARVSDGHPGQDVGCAASTCRSASSTWWPRRSSSRRRAPSRNGWSTTYPIGEVLFTRAGVSFSRLRPLILPQTGLAVFRTAPSARTI